MHHAVSKTYATAATQPQPGLCCPKDYQSELTAHIPKDAFDYNYGCGSPVLKSAIREGEHVVDLGSGVGIDCFVASKIVGPSGRVTGIDMTDEMLARANTYRTQVADTLGFGNVEFRHGQIESIPLDDNSVDVVLSNCVINLSPDKPQVFRDMKRVLKSGGRVVISDIVSDREVLPEHQADENLWGGCYTGALSAQQFIAAFEAAGFVGLTQIAESSWEEKAGYRFASLTIAAYKPFKGAQCLYEGQLAIYLGPYSAVSDDAGHIFNRFKPTEICTDTAKQLAEGPYAKQFIVTAPAPARRAATNQTSSCCSTGDAKGGCC